MPQHISILHDPYQNPALSTQLVGYRDDHVISVISNYLNYAMSHKCLVMIGLLTVIVYKAYQNMSE